MTDSIQHKPTDPVQAKLAELQQAYPDMGWELFDDPKGQIFRRRFGTKANPQMGWLTIPVSKVLDWTPEKISEEIFAQFKSDAGAAVKNGQLRWEDATEMGFDFPRPIFVQNVEWDRNNVAIKRTDGSLLIIPAWTTIQA